MIFWLLPWTAKKLYKKLVYYKWKVLVWKIFVLFCLNQILTWSLVPKFRENTVSIGYFPYPSIFRSFIPFDTFFWFYDVSTFYNEQIKLRDVFIIRQNCNWHGFTPFVHRCRFSTNYELNFWRSGSRYRFPIIFSKI